jgi:redox-sensitive bicupin YhaK (pirin superfamily)
VDGAIRESHVLHFFQKEKDMNRPVIQVQPIFDVQRASERATFNHGWLRTSHSFSFADYFDPRNTNWGALRVVNDDWVDPGEGFGTHPHRDMEIVTYVLSGQLEHRDSLGNHGIVGPGGVQYMSAGTGVRHSEFNHSSSEILHFLQMWVLPGSLGGKPLYGQAEFDIDQRRNRWLHIASGSSAVDAPVRLTQNATMAVTRLEDGELRHTFEPGRLGFLFVAEGDIAARAYDDLDIQIADEMPLVTGDAVRIGGVSRVSVRGSGELVLWDVPRLPDGANDDEDDR